MKKTVFKIIAELAGRNAEKAVKTTCWGLSYEPKAPANIKNFKK